MSIILGFHGDHDGSLALVKDGKLIGAMSKERYTRIKKNHNGNDESFIKYFLNHFNITLEDITHVALCDDWINDDDTFIKFHKDNYLIKSIGSTHLKGKEYNELVASFNGKKVPAFHVQHHLSHCAYAFYTSNFQNAVCLSMDSSYGFPIDSSIVAVGEGNKIKILRCPNLFVGNFYDKMTERLGLGIGLFKAGTLMGLASYGKVKPNVKDNWQEYSGDNYDASWSKISGFDENTVFYESGKDSPEAMDIAASTQYVFEEAVLAEVKKIFKETKKTNHGNICLSGGSFLNCNVNTKIALETDFKNVSISPACGDDGLAIGSALYVAHNLLGYDRIKYTNSQLMYLGPEHKFPKIGSPLNMKFVAKMLQEGKIIALYQGRSEFGPRALGNRSILANPAIKGMKDILNSRVKFREWFRPFAPSVLVEKYSDWFDLPFESPFMLYTCLVKNPELIPAVTHVDNTARIQTVRREDNPRYYDIINEFYKLTKIPLLLNTSLNINGEPIVETPLDALRFLKESDVDALILEDCLILKEEI